MSVKYIQKPVIFLPFLLLVFLIILSACSAQAQVQGREKSVEPTPVVVRILNLSIALQITPTAPPTFTPLPTFTPSATFTTSPPNPGESVLAELSPTPACSNRAEFVKHLNLSDNSALKVDEVFAKLWQVRNIGTCVWTPAFSLVLVAGEALGSPTAIALPTEVAPGETVDLRTDMISPSTPGSYSSQWMLQDPSGVKFGTGESGIDPLNLLFTVKTPPRPTPS